MPITRGGAEQIANQVKIGKMCCQFSMPELLAIELGTITRIGSVGQRSSTIDLVISGPGRGIDSLHATIAEDLRTESDHEVITWELFTHHEGNDPINQIPDDTPAWKLLPPIKNDDTDEFKEWQEK
jgi:hypothetical protein